MSTIYSGNVNHALCLNCWGTRVRPPTSPNDSFEPHFPASYRTNFWARAARPLHICWDNSSTGAIAFLNPRSKPLVALAESVWTITVTIKLQLSIKSLGIYLDSCMSFDKQVLEICKAWYFHIRALRHICSSLTTEAAKTIAVASQLSARILFLHHQQPLYLAQILPRYTQLYNHSGPLLL